jgi:hypothetical protein
MITAENSGVLPQTGAVDAADDKNQQCDLPQEFPPYLVDSSR